MKRDPLLSVVIACFNQADVLELTLKSFLQQKSNRQDYELIVIDDHSKDDQARHVVATCKALEK